MTNSSAIGKSYIGSLQNEADRAKAARFLSEGKLVAFFNRGVNAIWLDAENILALETIPKIKGRQRIGKPLSLTIGFEHLFHMIDLSKIHHKSHKLLKTLENLKQSIGSLCFLRFPVKPEFVSHLPQSTVSFDNEGTPWIQNWDAHGHFETEDLLSKAKKLGVKFAAVTSMNLSGEPEVVNQEEAKDFCRKNGIPMYLEDPKVYPSIKGSYTIFTLTINGIELTRDGNIPGRIIAEILGTKVESNQKTKQPRHSQMEFPDSLYQNLPPEKIRHAVLMYIKGIDPLEINHKLSRD